MEELTALQALARFLGVRTEYTDGLGRAVTVGSETLVRVCAALGAPVGDPVHAAEALAHLRNASMEPLPPVRVAWNGILPEFAIADGTDAALTLEAGDVVPLPVIGGVSRLPVPLPHGYHRLDAQAGGRLDSVTLISAPTESWRRPGDPGRSWGVGTHLAALRSARSRSVGDLQDLETVCRWVQARGGDLVTVLPLLPTFNTEPPEPSPYAAVSRLFWSELILDLGEAHRATGPVDRLDVTRAMAEVRAALAGTPAADPSTLDAELVRYARFRAAQARLGRNWRDWPAAERRGRLDHADVDAEEERFHLVAQTMARTQLHDLRGRLEGTGFRLGLDLAVGMHPDGYDPWSRPELFVPGMSVGAPPDQGFPSGQDWGFPPLHPVASRREAHRYVAASIAHQMELAGVLRVDHIMAWTRLYWIPHGMGLDQGTYVGYPAEELFAILTLESHRHQCEVIGENLGTVPPEIVESMRRHRVRGMYLAQFEAAGDEPITGPSADEVALFGTHDTPTFGGWLAGEDIGERVTQGLLPVEEVPAVTEERVRAMVRLAEHLGESVEDRRSMLGRLLEWLGGSPSPLVVAWLEDLWLEEAGVNLPGTPSSCRPNWQRPMRHPLEAVFTDPAVGALVRRLASARRPAG